MEACWVAGRMVLSVWARRCVLELVLLGRGAVEWVVVLRRMCLELLRRRVLEVLLLRRRALELLVLGLWRGIVEFVMLSLPLVRNRLVALRTPLWGPGRCVAVVLLV